MTALNLDTPIERLPSVGSKHASRLKRLGVSTLRHLLWHLPSRYEDYSQRILIQDLAVGTKVTIQGEIIKTTVKRIFSRRMTIVESIIQDDSGAVRAIWFNQPYLANTLSEGIQVSLAGKVQLNKRGVYLSSPTYEKLSDDLRHTAGLIPIYPETHGITSKYLRFLIQPLLKDLIISDPLPETVRQKLALPELGSALRIIHYPTSEDDIEHAKQRLAFDDLLLFQLKALIERRRVRQQQSVSVTFDAAFIKKVIASLPFTLTGDQKIAVWEILSDLEKPYPMNRLLEGDVGSGKTVVAFLAALQAAQQGLQTVLMAPTEVLALQHFNTMHQLGGAAHASIALLTSTQAILDGQPVSKTELKKNIALGGVKIIVGTHAVIQKDVKFNKLALAVVDEQHRFGITQRAALLQSAEIIPHLLSMTATPIPRTLALTIFGDLDISLIRQKPKDRKEIMTEVVAPPQRPATYTFIDEEISRGRQVFVICPRIEVSDPTEAVGGSKQRKLNVLWQEVKAVTEEYEKLSKEVFPHRRVAMLHGKLKPREKQEIMVQFKNGWYDILVATSVVEVGVDVPNATIMMIENADRFGLAQLHQFRGRVGRAEHQSYCFLFQTNEHNGVQARLTALKESNDGFSLAEKDMSMRGPGEFFGVKQSGMPDLTMTALADMELIKKARLHARTLLKSDPSLKKYPLLRQRLSEFQRLSHFE
jgi:ATP-dependent DNA helicase RecG